MFEYAEQAQDRGIKVIIAGAGGAAHLPGMVASKTMLPVIGVPIQSKALNGMDSLTVDCSNAWRCSGCNDGDWKSRCSQWGLLAAQILGISDNDLMKRIEKRRIKMRNAALESSGELL